MNFFQSIVAMQIAGDWKITIAKETAERLIVSVLLFNDKIGDDARKLIQPVLLKGTAQEIDEGFFAAIAQPMQDTAQLFVNMEQYLSAREQAKVQSQMEKDNAAKAEKLKAEKDKKYTDALKKADELEGEGKYRDAWMKVPDVSDYPDHAEEIKTRKSALAKLFAPDLFNADPKN